VAQDYLTGGTLHSLARQHDLSRNLIRIWIQEFEDGAFNGEAAAVDTTGAYEARIAALERLVGRDAPNRVSKGGSEARTAAERDYIRGDRLCGISVAEGRRLMGIARSARSRVAADRRRDVLRPAPHEPPKSGFYKGRTA
jgi:transposase-like protein